MSSSTVLIIALICLAIGFLAGLLVASLTSNRTSLHSDPEESPPPTEENPSTELSSDPENEAPPRPVQSENSEIEALAPPKDQPDQEKIASPAPVFNGGKVVKPGVKPETDPKNGVPGSQSIVQQIDVILQDQIAGTGLHTKGVRLVEMPDQGVMVWIGLKSYHGIDTVDDPEVVAAIRKAVQTWETKGR